MLVSDIADLLDLLRARALCEAGAELGDVQGDSQFLGIVGASADPLSVPAEALVSEGRVGLACGAWIAS